MILSAREFMPWGNPGYQDSKPFKAIPVAYVPASFPVNFALFTCGRNQYAAFYNPAHQMTIACRRLNDSAWDYHSLDSKVGWDSHNYLALFIDKEGYIHLPGNMHSSPLIYYRSKIPFDIHSLQAVRSMTGIEEDMVTYPDFIEGPGGELIFHYRYGRSGSGYEVFNMWVNESKRWIRMLDKPLTDGRGKMNAYMQGPILGPDGNYHLIWVWRDTPDCATNHTLSYARSKVTGWNYRWDFKGYGTIINELLIEPPKPSSVRGYIVFGYHHIKYGDGQVVVDEETLLPVRTEELNCHREPIVFIIKMLRRINKVTKKYALK